MITVMLVAIRPLAHQSRSLLVLQLLVTNVPISPTTVLVSMYLLLA